MSRRKIDWDAIKTEYVTTDISIRALSEKHKIDKNLVASHCKNDKWVKARKDYRTRVTTKAITKSCNKRAAELSELFDIALNVKDTLKKASKDPEQFNRYIVQYGTGNGKYDTEERIYDKVDMRAVKDLMQSMKVLEDIMRSVGNIKTDAEEQRLRIEKEKWEREKAEQSAAHEVHITFDTDDLEGWTE